LEYCKNWKIKDNRKYRVPKILEDTLEEAGLEEEAVSRFSRLKKS